MASQLLISQGKPIIQIRISALFSELQICISGISYLGFILRLIFIFSPPKINYSGFPEFDKKSETDGRNEGTNGRWNITISDLQKQKKSHKAYKIRLMELSFIIN